MRKHKCRDTCTKKCNCDKQCRTKADLLIQNEDEEMYLPSIVLYFRCSLSFTSRFLHAVTACLDFFFFRTILRDLTTCVASFLRHSLAINSLQTAVNLCPREVFTFYL